MKKSLILIILLVSAVVGFAQGKLLFANDSVHLVYFTSDTTKLNPADAGVAGKGAGLVTFGSLVGAPSLSVDLYAGVTSSSLTLQTTTTFFGASEGRWNSVNMTFPALPAGVAAYFQIQVHDIRAPDAASCWAVQGLYAGTSPVFTAVPQLATYGSICSLGPPVNSTWPPGTFQIVDMPPGNLGAIELYATVPEPATSALAGLGAAALLIACRRK